jgi:hypothetical protein
MKLTEEEFGEYIRYCINSKYKNHFIGINQWISIDDELPKLDLDVIVCREDGTVGYGMRAEVSVPDLIDGRYRHQGRKEIQWGHQENDFEYWNNFKVTYWMHLPKPPYT